RAPQEKGQPRGRLVRRELPEGLAGERRPPELDTVEKVRRLQQRRGDRACAVGERPPVLHLVLAELQVPRDLVGGERPAPGLAAERLQERPRAGLVPTGGGRRATDEL